MHTARLALIFIFISWTPLAFAGLFDIGMTANYKTSRLDDKNYQESLSYTASVSYYFWHSSALELSYTKGTSLLSVKISDIQPREVFTSYFELIGLDFVLTLASRQAAFQPYLKVGGAQIYKKIIREPGDDPGDFQATEIGPPTRSVVPSAGAGLKLKLTERLSLKIGFDAWSTPLDQKPVKWDYAGRAGFSWLM